MENVILSIHLILALLLIGVVLLQRSEGGALGMGGGGGGGVMSGRAAANALTKMTWGLAVAFLITSVTLTIIAARNAEEGSVVDRITAPETAPVEAPVVPAPLDVAPPPAADAPVTPPNAE